MPQRTLLVFKTIKVSTLIRTKSNRFHFVPLNCLEISFFLLGRSDNNHSRDDFVSLIETLSFDDLVLGGHSEQGN